MGYLKQVEDVSTSTPLYTFSRMKPSLEMGLSRRSGTFPIANLDFGIDPFASSGAPIKTRDFKAKFRVLTHKDYDGARDALFRAVGSGDLLRLVYITAKGKERVASGKAVEVAHTYTEDADIFADFEVTFEVNELWHERAPIGFPVVGAANQIVGTTGAGGSNLIVGANVIPLVTGGATGVFATNTVNIDALTAGPGGVATAYDTRPVITVNGAYGSALGFVVANLSITLLDPNGNPYHPYFGVNLARALGDNESVTVRCGAKSVTATLYDANANLTNYGLEDFFVVPDWQPYWMAVKPGVVNQISVYCSSAAGIPASTAKSSIIFAGLRRFY